MESKRRRVSKELDYKLVQIVLKNPEGGYMGMTFWTDQIVHYGNKFFDGYTAQTLKGRWRKLNDLYSSNIMEYNDELERFIGEIKVKKIKDQLLDIENYDDAENEEEPKKVKKEEKPDKDENKNKGENSKWFIMEARRKFADSAHNIGTEEDEEFGPPKKTHITEATKPEEKPVMINITNLMKNNPLVQKLAETSDKGQEVNDYIEYSHKTFAHKSPITFIYRDFATGKFESFNIPIENPTERKKFFEIKQTLIGLSFVYKVPLNIIEDYFQAVSCSFSSLERYLKGEKVELWSAKEDEILSHPEWKEEYDALIARKTPEQIERRKKFLDLA